MRVAIDLQAVQSSGSRYRGIGRYAEALLQHLLQIPSPVQYDLYRNGRLPAPNGLTLLDTARTVNYDPYLVSDVDEVLFKTTLLHDRPDALFLLSPMEMSDTVIPSFADFPIPICAICYDAIPLLFPNHYLDDHHAFTVYHQRLQNLRHADFLFAISEATRQDLIRLLGVSPDKTINISAGVSPFFSPLLLGERAEWQATFAQKWNITRPFVMSTGAEDWRKNGDGLVRAFAQLSPDLIKEHQLVIVGQLPSEITARLRASASREGLSQSDIVFTGFVSDDELRALYGICKLFVFPSRYEGFGLPLVEALACGAAVITGNNSSLTEIVPSPAQLFDATSVESITVRMESLLRDDAKVALLRARAVQDAAQFTWQKVAEKVSAVFEQGAAIFPAPHETFVFRRAGETESAVGSESTDSAQSAAGNTANASGVQNRSANSAELVKPLVAFWSPFRPLESGISDYSEEILPALSHYYGLDLFVDDGYKPLVETGTSHRILNHRDFVPLVEQQHRDYYATIHQMGNSQFHLYQYAALLRYAGITVLHDYNMNGMVNFMAALQPESGITLHGELAYHYGAEKACAVVEDLASKKYAAVDLPAQGIFTNRRIFARSLGVALHSTWAYEKAVEEHSDICPHIALIPPVMPPVPLNDTPEDILRLREKWGVPPAAFVFASCGIVAETKRPLQILDAFKTHLSANPDAFLLFVGSIGTPFDFNAEIKKRGLQNHVKITGYVGIPLFNECLRLSDVCVTLRFPSNGETSGALLRMLVHGKPSIVTAIGSFDDFPDDTVHKLPTPDKMTDEVGEILQAFRKLQGDSAYRQKLGTAAADYMHREHSPERCAQLYAAFVKKVMMDPMTRTRLLADYAGREVGRVVLGNKKSSKAIQENDRLFAPFESVLSAPALDKFK